MIRIDYNILIHCVPKRKPQNPSNLNWLSKFFHRLIQQ